MASEERNPKVVVYLYILVLLCFLFCHIDTGILAVSNTLIKDYFKISDSQIGLLATGLYIGNVGGTISSPLLFARFQAKHVLVLAAIGNALTCGIFSVV
jgi:fucose permease